MSLRQGGLSTEEARSMMERVENNGIGTSSEDIRATFMADLGLAFTRPSEASMEELSSKFEDLAMFQEFTHLDPEQQ